MKTRSVFAVVAFMVAAAGVGFLVRSLYRSQPVSSATVVPGLIDESSAARLESAEQYLTPLTDEDRASIPGRLAEAARFSSSDPRDAILLQLFEERISLMIDPHRPRYLAHIARITGRSADEIEDELGERHAKRWDIDTRILREASFGLDGCEIEPGERGLHHQGGVAITMNDPGVYGSERLLAEPDAELRQVRVPVIIAVKYAGEGKTLLLYLVMGFVWDNGRSTWIPHLTGFFDPTGEETRLPAPWI